MKSNRSSAPIKVMILFVLLLLLLISVVEAQKSPDDPSPDGVTQWNDGRDVSPSMAVVIIVLVIGFFITGFISIYIQQCTTSSSSSTSILTATNRNNTVRGLDQSVIDTFPVFPYSEVKELKIGKGALECAVCLCEFEDDETLRFLPKCDHVFHAECIDTWLKGHTTCPVCRDNLVVVDPTTNSHNQPDDEDLQSSATPTNSTSEVQITINDNNETTWLPKKLPRAHSTGHSLIQAGENCERYTLRLPAEVRKELLARTKLKRAKSLVTLPRQTSSRRGYRTGGGGGGEGSGSSRYGRFFGRSFLMRVASFRSTVKIGADGDLKEPKTGSTDHSYPPPIPV